jgi:hypothetical protein
MPDDRALNTKRQLQGDQPFSRWAAPSERDMGSALEAERR